MLFNSFSFLFLFLPVVVLVYWTLRSTTQRKYLSFVASYVFYGVWSAKFALLMLLTTSTDFFTAQFIEDSPSPARRRAWLALSMAVNLGVLAIFKYYDFFAGSLNHAFALPLLPILEVVLPIGISFYTFESMSYTVDVYRRKLPAVRRFIDYGHFVTMFPRLVAGPIVRYSEVADQLERIPARLAAPRLVEAVHFFVIGMAKKVFIADRIAARLVDPLFATPRELQLVSGWAAALGYTAQLYMDFSGYSDMAVGLGLLLGFRFTRNFHLPYRAANISEFWRRWHVSLSTWLRDYLYIPLGGSRAGSARVKVNLFLTMLLGGLWHGAKWTFVAWGAFHGVLLVLHHFRLLRGVRLPRAIQIAWTFGLVVLGWVLFRSDSLPAAAELYRAMAGLHGVGLGWLGANAGALAFLLVALGLSFTLDTYDVRPGTRTRWAICYGLVLAACIARLEAPSPFLYFQF